MKNLFTLALHELTSALEANNPKNIVLTGMEDIKKNAGKLKKLDIEERKMLTEYVLRKEINKVRGCTHDNDYGITVGTAIEKQRRFTSLAA